MRWPWTRVAVSGVSMIPTFLPGDLLVVRRVGGRRRVRVGDIVVAWRPGGELLVVKRVRRVLDDGRLWLEGDNIDAGAVADDSRRFGAVAPDAVVGRVVGRYWPVGRRR